MFRNLSTVGLPLSGRPSELIELALSFVFDGMDIDILDMEKQSAAIGVEHARRLMVSARLKSGLFHLPVRLDADEAAFAVDIADLPARLEVAAACDLRIAADNAHFGMPEVKVGVPSVVEAALLPRLIGWGRTSRMLLTAENIDAAKAEAWGLVEEVVPAARLAEAVERCVHSIVEGTPLAVRAQKRLMRRWERLPLDEAVQAGIDSFAQSVSEGEHIEPMTAFVNRKKK